MLSISSLLRKQGHFVLENDFAALAYVAILALIPFSAWLSAAVVALITLRKGASNGFKGLAVGVVSCLSLSLMSMPLMAATVNALTTFLPCYLMALMLRATVDWQWAVNCAVLQVLLAVILLHWLMPEFIMEQYRYFQVLFKQLDSNLSVSFMDDHTRFSHTIIAHYLVGIQFASLALSAMASLALARSVQSNLFCPGGFKQEMLAFRANSYGVILLIITAVSAYQHNVVAIGCLPILITYYVLAGLSLGCNVFAKNRGIGTLLLLAVPVVIIPFTTLLVYVVFGALDSFFNFRVHLPFNAGGKQNKG